MAWLQKQIRDAMAARITSVEGFSEYRQMRKAFALGGPDLPENQQCFVCQDAATLRHHIIPLILGGRSKFSNLVPLCHRCHVEVHTVGPREPKSVEPADSSGALRIQSLLRQMYH